MTTTQPMPGALDKVILSDHAHVAQLIARLSSPTADRAILSEQIEYLLSVHAVAVDQVVQPELKRIGETYSTSITKAHDVIKSDLAEVEKGSPGDGAFDAALNRVADEVTAYANDAKKTWLPLLRERLSEDELQELGSRFRRAELGAPSRVHPKGSSNSIASTLTAAVDMARDMTSHRGDVLLTDASGLLDPDAQEVVDAFGDLAVKPIELTDPKQARKSPTFKDAVLKVLKNRGESTDPEAVAEVEDITLAGDVKARVYRPAADTSLVPLVAYVHGGGWVIADIDVYDASPRALANALGATIVSIEYRKAPEHPFPAAHIDVHSAILELAQRSREFGSDGKIALVGESAGGNMVASSIPALRSAGVTPAFATLVYPVTTSDQNWDSFTQAADAVPLNSAMMDWFSEHLVGDEAPDTRLNVLDLPAGDLAQFPPTPVITAERDPLRDQGGEFARRLKTAGVEVSSLRFNGVPHEFYGGGAVISKAKKAVAVTASAFSAAVSGQPLPQSGEHQVN